MKVLVLGGTGATGKLLVKELLSRNIEVTVIVRSPDRLLEEVRDHKMLTIVTNSISSIDILEIKEYLSGCDAIISCLGHNLSFKGIYGKPLKLVTNAVKLICSGIKDSKQDKLVKLVLMNTTGNKNKDLKEKRSFVEKLVIGLIRLLLPPQRDNECAANYLRSNIGQRDKSIQWIAVRPDSLIDATEVSEYNLHPSPVRSPIFDPGKTSRINVGHFMAELVTDQALWENWKGQMPVIYNRI